MISGLLGIRAGDQGEGPYLLEFDFPDAGSHPSGWCLPAIRIVEAKQSKARMSNSERSSHDISFL